LLCCQSRTTTAIQKLLAYFSVLGNSTHNSEIIIQHGVDGYRKYLLKHNS
jgi:hypothetical protein